MNKIIQQQQPISQIPQVVDVEIFWKLIENLERGINSTNLINVLIAQDNPRLKMESNDDQHQGDYYTALVDHHSMVCLDSYATSLSMLKSLDFDGVFARKRKLEDDDNHVDVISQGSTDMLGSPKNPTTTNGRRECNKRRKNGESREEEVSQLTDDGFAWRKYGQKLIHNYHHPRHYYRCTHKNEQNCKATKQVQQVSDKPTKYKITYHSNHTCNSILKTSSSMIDFPEDHPSAFVLSFVGSNQQVNPMLFPTSAFPTKVAEQNNQNNSPSISSIYNPSISQNSTATTTGLSSNPKSEQCTEEVSVAENYYSSTATSFNWEEDFSFIMAADYSDLLPDWWTS